MSGCTALVVYWLSCSHRVDRWFEPGSGQNKDYNIDICFFSAKYIALKRERANIGWLRIGIMCRSGRHSYLRSAVSVS